MCWRQLKAIGNFLALYRTEGAGTHRSVAEILGNSLIYGTVAGVVGLLCHGAHLRPPGCPPRRQVATRAQVVHVLAYGGVPLAASLGIWLLTALLVGEAAFVETPRGDVEGFVVLLLHLQFISYTSCC